MSFRLDVGRPDHLSPFFGFLSNEPAELSRRADKRRASKIGKPRLYLGIGEAGIDLVVELGDNLCRCVLGRANTLPCANLVPRQEIPHRRNVWQRVQTGSRSSPP